MRYVVTKHAMQRRDWKRKVERDYLLSWLNTFNKKFKFKTFDQGYPYKISLSRKKFAVVVIEKNTALLVTFNGFEEEDKLAENMIVKKGPKERTIYRKNFLGRRVKCGKIKEENGVKTLILAKNLKKKFVIESKYFQFKFKEESEINHIVTKKKNIYILNDFERNPDYKPNRKPKIFISKCLTGKLVRYDGKGNYLPGIDILKKKYDLIEFCPEEKLGCPRDPIEIVEDKAINIHGIDLSEILENEIERGIELAKRKMVDFALLKEKSPTCGVHKIYDGTHTGTLIDGSGLLTRKLIADEFKVYADTEIWDLIEKIYGPNGTSKGC